MCDYEGLATSYMLGLVKGGLCLELEKITKGRKIHCVEKK